MTYYVISTTSENVSCIVAANVLTKRIDVLTEAICDEFEINDDEEIKHELEYMQVNTYDYGETCVLRNLPDSLSHIGEIHITKTICRIYN